VRASVGEPINEEAWHWYNDHVGDKRCPVVDTWWQTETGGIMISLSFVTPTKPTYATLPLPESNMWMKRNEIEGNQVVGSLCIKYPWPVARTIGVIINYKTYFTAFPGKYFTGDGLYVMKWGITELQAV
jgi:acetyl-CoA synthetase